MHNVERQELTGKIALLKDDIRRKECELKENREKLKRYEKQLDDLQKGDQLDV